MADERKAPEMREIATTRDGRDITRPWVNALRLMPPADTVLTAQGGNYVTYEEILKDDQVMACLQQRHLAVTSKSWVVEPGDERRASKQAAKFLEETLKRLPWDEITRKMLFGVYYGYAVAECLWSRDGDRVVLADLKVRKQRRFGFDPEGKLLLLTLTNMLGEEVPERKFWHFRVGADNDDEAYGLGLAHWLYWPVTIKRGGVDMWLAFLDKFGLPTTIGTYPQSSTDQERRKLLDAVAAIQSDSGVAIPEGMKIEFLEAARGGKPGYDDLVKLMNGAISKVVLSQTMTTDDGSSRAQGEVHWDVRQELVESDADIVCDSFSQTVGRWLTEWNFPGAALPRVRRETESPEDQNTVADRIEKLKRAGWTPEQAEVERLFGGKWSQVGSAPQEQAAPPPAPAKDAAFADPPQRTAPDSPDRIIERAAPLLAPMLERLNDPVRELVTNATDWDELRADLLALYPAMDASALSATLADAMAVAELAGRWDVSNGR